MNYELLALFVLISASVFTIGYFIMDGESKLSLKLHERLKLKIEQITRISAEAKESVESLRTSLMAQKTELDQIAANNGKLQEMVSILDFKIKNLQDQVHGSILKLPEKIEISIVKEKQDAGNRDQQKKATAKKQVYKVRK